MSCVALAPAAAEASCSGRCWPQAAAWRATPARRSRRRHWMAAVRAQQQQQQQQAGAAAPPPQPSSSSSSTETPSAAAVTSTLPVEAAAAAQQEQVATPYVQPLRPQAADPYRLAGQRLRSLLSGVGDGEEELLNNLLEEESPDRKLALCLLAASLISGGAAAVCWLCGLDPLGGASLSLSSAHAAAVGGAAAAPLVALKWLLWSEGARQQLPFLDDIHKAQVDAFKPVLSNLNTAQTLVLLATEVVPSLLILLPATTGGIAKSLQMYGSMAGVELPDFLPGVLALMITATIAGVGKVAETSVTLEEYEVVKNALDNADRYYRVMAMDRDSTAVDAQRAAEAFKTVALTWMARNQVAVRFAAALGAAEVLYLGVLWQQTGDLTAPMVAALGASAVDFAFIRRRMGAQAGGTSTS